jgi:D-beta-D-heptose 7-phosphate kinase/D-beta-D-heptose 1-phosphate adenosyltransferase
MPTLTLTRARRLLAGAERHRVLVVGDVMLDEFIWGRVARISPEAPVPVVEVTGQSFHVGGAGNVAANLRSLGAEAVLAGVVGEDDAGRRLDQELRAAGVEPALAATAGRPTTVKTRIVAHNQQVVRADREVADDVSGDVEEAVAAQVRAHAPRCRAVLVSDYRKGVVTKRLLRLVLALAKKHGLPVLVDPKVRDFGFYRGVTVATPNQLEAEQAAGLPARTEADLERAGARLLKVMGCRALLVTRGERGMSLFEAGRPATHIPAAAREVFDVTGAGDTVIATFTLSLCAGASYGEAAMLANRAAGIVVGKVGTATATRDEILSAMAP